VWVRVGERKASGLDVMMSRSDYEKGIGIVERGSTSSIALLDNQYIRHESPKIWYPASSGAPLEM
jgi:hypothetical protein